MSATIINKVYTLDDLKSINIELYNSILDKHKLYYEFKNVIRHKVINNFDDFSDEDKSFLLRLKEDVFEGNTIYVFGSRINGRYITKEEVATYSSLYPNIKESDWDIQSLFFADKYKLDLFAKENGVVKIELNIGKHKIEV